MERGIRKCGLGSSWVTQIFPMLHNHMTAEQISFIISWLIAFVLNNYWDYFRYSFTSLNRKALTITEQSYLKECFLAWSNKSSFPGFPFAADVSLVFWSAASASSDPNNSFSPAAASTNLGFGVGLGFRLGLGLRRGFATGSDGLGGFWGLALTVKSLSKSSSILFIKNWKMNNTTSQIQKLKLKKSLGDNKSRNIERSSIPWAVFSKPSLKQLKNSAFSSQWH